MQRQKKNNTKSDISRFMDISYLNKKKATLATKAELTAEQNKKEKLQTYDSSVFIGQC